MCAYPATASSAARRSSTSVSPVCVGVSQVMRRRDADLRGDPTGRRQAGARYRPCRHGYATEYAKERHALVADHQEQGIAFMLADMATEVEATRALIWKAAWLGKQRAFKNVKMKAGRVATWTTERAIQILGGYGYTREYPVERWHRDQIHDMEGTEQIQQLVISRAISGMRIE